MLGIIVGGGPAYGAESEEGASLTALAASNTPMILLPGNSTWKYYDQGGDQGSVWQDVYDDSTWASGSAPLGYKDDGSDVKTTEFGGLKTVINYGSSKSSKYITSYFRTTFDASNIESFGKIEGLFGYDDGVVLYLNGAEIYREGVKIGHDYLTTSPNNKSDPNIATVDLTSAVKGKLRNGINILAAEIHQNRGSSSDLYWDMSLVAYPPVDPNTPLPGVQGKPESIAMTFNGNPQTSRAFAWYTNPAVTATKLEVVEASKVNGNVFPSVDVRTYEGASVTASVYISKADKTSNKPTLFASHKVIADGLQPGTKYAYRAGDGQADNWSEIGTFTTEAVDNRNYTFLYTTDSQGTSKGDFDIWNHTLEEGVRAFPNSQFILNSGDLVDNGDLEEQWSWFFNQAKNVLMNYTLVPVVGNHESKNYSNFTTHFNLPERSNTGAAPAGSVYSVDYGPAHFMVLNTEYIASNASYKDVYEKQVQWLRSEVAKTDKKWKVVFLHKSPYSVANHNSDSDVKYIRENLTKVFDELGIDMVLGGHDHTYTRSYQMYANKPLTDMKPDAQGKVVDPRGTLYLLTNAAGDKVYQPKGVFEYAAKYGQPNKQMFTGVNVNDQTLSFEAYTTTVGGSTDLYDTYTIQKSDEISNPVKNAKLTATEDGSMVLTWDAPQGSNVTSYRIYEKNDQISSNWNVVVPHEAEKTSYTYTVNGLDAKKTYQFVIRAVSGRTNSAPVIVTNLQVPVSKVTVTFKGDPTTAKGFTWYTPLASEGNDLQVIEAASVKGGAPDFALAAEFKGRSYVSTNSGTERVHKAEATGLKANTSYYFRVGDAALNSWSEVGTFQTAPVNGAFTFIDLADTQAKTEDEAILSAETLAKSMATVPDVKFVLHNGDIVDTGTKEEQWNWLLGHSQSSLNNITIVPAAGNHEDKNYAFIDHFNLQEAPGSDTKTGAYYSYDYSNAHFIILNTNENSDAYANFSAAQIDWLKQDVSAAKKAGKKWIIVNIHKGPYTTSNHATDKDIMGANGVRTKVAPLMAELGIDFVVQGHDHIYARTKPIKKDGTAAATEKITETVNGKKLEYTVRPDGTIYMIPATAGPKVYYKNKKPELGDTFYNLFELAEENHAAKYGPDPSDNTRPMRSQVQNFVKVTIDGDKLTAITYEIDQNINDAKPFIVDQFGINKSAKPETPGPKPENPGPNPTSPKPNTPSETKPPVTETKPDTSNGGKGQTGNGHTGTTPSASMSDTIGHWAEATIQKALEAGFVTGYEDSTFRPNQSVNRAEFITLLARALQLSSSNYPLNFKDVKQIPAWSQSFVASALEAGIVKGYADQSFRPNQHITRAEMAAMIVRASGLQVNPNAKLTFADAKDVPTWAVSAIAAVAEAGLVKGTGDNKFAPNQTATRAEAVTLIIALLQHQAK
ncbi:S-layer homology domain-containing protein [Paenibacillus guangzhouensis]|uniref:S-layer homology domain-containing protein n=1 Tax=Paenibacillus guangzhouensis TaxID=1473112 RepID=UPI00187BB8B4|nr:S-layer homology domain-containing protein [Paenibacillus guangzhouensis]